jgi:large subunit ribosomal protein L23
MGIFSRIKSVAVPKKEEDVKAPAASAEKPKKATKATKTSKKAKTEETASDEVKPEVSKKGAAFAHILLSPRVSEKAAVLSAMGSYVFNVPIETNKIEVKKAVEAMYGVNVMSVNTIRGEGKATQRGRIQGRRNRWKKAVVTLKPGQKIDLYEGV